MIHRIISSFCKFKFSLIVLIIPLYVTGDLERKVMVTILGIQVANRIDVASTIQLGNGAIITKQVIMLVEYIHCPWEIRRIKKAFLVMKAIPEVHKVACCLSILNGTNLIVGNLWQTRSAFVPIIDAWSHILLFLSIKVSLLLSLLMLCSNCHRYVILLSVSLN